MKDNERIAKRFHEVYESDSVMFGYETRKSSAVPWEDLNEQNKMLMIHVVSTLLSEGTIKP